MIVFPLWLVDYPEGDYFEISFKFIIDMLKEIRNEYILVILIYMELYIFYG